MNVYEWANLHNAHTDVIMQFSSHNIVLYTVSELHQLAFSLNIYISIIIILYMYSIILLDL